MQVDKEKKMSQTLAQLRWACRRGMLELDVLLGNFLNEVYSDLSFEDQLTFGELLNEADPVLFSWLLGQIKPQDDKKAHLVEMIRQHAQSRH